MQKNKVTLYKDGDIFGIASSCDDGGYFLDEVTGELADLIESGKFEDDWWFQLQGWMPHIIDVYNQYENRLAKRGEVVCSGFTLKRKDQ